jgi:hypothetical protein
MNLTTWLELLITYGIQTLQIFMICFRTSWGFSLSNSNNCFFQVIHNNLLSHIHGWSKIQFNIADWTYYLVLLPALSLNYHKHSDRRIQLELPYHYYWNFDQMSYILQLHTSYICTRGTCTNDRMKWNSFQLIKLNFTIFHSAYWENAPT